MRTSTALHVVRASALYDLVVTSAFAVPWAAAATLHGLGAAHESWGLPGVVPGDDPFTVLFATLMGSIVVVWAGVRTWRPTLALGAADTVGRGLFSLGMVVALADGASLLVAGFLTLEVAWFVVQGGAVAAALRGGAPLDDRRPATIAPSLAS